MNTGIPVAKTDIAAEVQSLTPRRASLVVNTKSRRGAEWFAQAKQALIDGGMDIVEFHAVRHPRHLPAIIARQVQSGIPLIIAGGGDGTFSAIAHLFAGKPTVLGVLPLGTGNSFARDLGIPADLNRACDTILNGKVAQVDMGLVGDRQFVNVATVGLSTKIALGLQDTLKKKWGRAVYIVSILKALITVKPFKVRLELPSGVHEFDCLQLVIGNGRFHAGPFPVTPDASITGGWLSIYALASRRKRDFLKMALHMRGGKQVDLAEVKAFRVQSGRLITTPLQLVTVDGEPCLQTPVEFGSVPGALRVMVPQDFS